MYLYVFHILTVFLMFSFAVSGCIAISRGIPGGLIQATWEKPASRRSCSSAMRPAISITGTFCFLARCKMPKGNLPISVWRSAEPSPVMTRLASCNRSSKWMVSNRRSMPCFGSRSQDAWQRPPQSVWREHQGPQPFRVLRLFGAQKYVQHHSRHKADW